MIPADSQMENAFVSRQKQNTKDFWMNYHGRIHELIYAELRMNAGPSLPDTTKNSFAFIGDNKLLK